MNENKFIPVKITDSKWAEKLLDGEVFMRPLYEFGGWNQKNRVPELKNTFRGDVSEGTSTVFANVEDCPIIDDLRNSFGNRIKRISYGKRIPLINTALPRANQYFTAWHEIYHLLFDEVSFDHTAPKPSMRQKSEPPENTTLPHLPEQSVSISFFRGGYFATASMIYPRASCRVVLK